MRLEILHMKLMVLVQMDIFILYHALRIRKVVIILHVLDIKPSLNALCLIIIIIVMWNHQIV